VAGRNPTLRHSFFAYTELSVNPRGE
jgi:hypothetical protein